MSLRLVAAACVLVPGLGLAAELGRLTLQSGVGEPLRAEIEVLAVRPGEAGTLAARIPPADVFWRANLEPSPVLDRLRVAVERRPGNRHVVVLRSTEALDEPFIQVLVELASSAGSVVREYPFLLEESRGRGQRAIAAPPPPEVGPRFEGATRFDRTPPTERGPAREAPALPDGDGYIVKPGDTLAAIAQAQRLDGVTLDQAIVAIYRANEHAFLDANLNLLRVGRTLVIPAVDAMRAIDPTEARQTVLAHGAVHASAAHAAAQSNAEPDRLSVSRAEPKPGGKAAATAREDDLASVQRALAEAQERIGLLEKNLDDVRALLALKDQQLVRMARQAQPAPLAGDAAAAGEAFDGRDAEGVLSHLLSHYGGWLVLGFVVGFASWVTMPLKTVRLWRKKRRRRQRDLRKHARRVRRAARKAGLLSTSS
ncbi:MAG TPA: FimV/HubP family polar landmark protein [Burkholderiales bacterium]|nr:FimV/HubP family polar landmark protein [Burkholderiales bacterium]